MHSCIYEGHVSHCRYEPVVHKFRYRLYMAYLDLAELRDSPAVRGLISGRRFSAVGFRAGDHLRGSAGPLDQAVRDLVEQRAGVHLTGPVRLLTQLRHFGYYFSPLNLYYCFDAAGTRVEAIVGEVNNTPWREQHHYVLAAAHGDGGGARMRFRHPKGFHVSPFLDMDYEYRWRLSVPEEQLTVHLENRQRGLRVFAASMSLSRQPLTRSRLTRTMVRYPVMTTQIMAAIYWQAFRLWWKKCPVYSHPAKRKSCHGPSV